MNKFTSFKKKAENDTSKQGSYYYPMKEDYCKEILVASVVNFFFLVTALVGQADVCRI